jgi:hypothetical protein
MGPSFISLAEIKAKEAAKATEDEAATETVPMQTRRSARQQGKAATPTTPRKGKEPVSVDSTFLTALDSGDYLNNDPRQLRLIDHFETEIDTAIVKIPEQRLVIQQVQQVLNGMIAAQEPFLTAERILA